jgi:heme/copper-type cytochrome/quinol oxidase subunit 2
MHFIVLIGVIDKYTFIIIIIVIMYVVIIILIFCVFFRNRQSKESVAIEIEGGKK